MRESMEIYPRTASERATGCTGSAVESLGGEDQVVTAGSGVGGHQRASAASIRRKRSWKSKAHTGPAGSSTRDTEPPARAEGLKTEQVLSLYRDKYFDLNVRHFHEKLHEEHQIELSYTWVKQALQAAGMVKRRPSCPVRASQAA